MRSLPHVNKNSPVANAGYGTVFIYRVELGVGHGVEAVPVPEHAPAIAGIATAPTSISASATMNLTVRLVIYGPPPHGATCCGAY